jgi:hypothetical protein
MPVSEAAKTGQIGRFGGLQPMGGDVNTQHAATVPFQHQVGLIHRQNLANGTLRG